MAYYRVLITGMKNLFFSNTDDTDKNGIVLKPEQLPPLKALMEAICRQEASELACRIGASLLKQTDWAHAKVLLETSGQDADVVRLHINLPNKGPIAQMEIYTWRDEDELIRIGVGSTEIEEFAMVQLPAGLARDLASQIISEAR
jgi:hypothetical protein